jgi:hypothetical protein
MFFVLDSVNSSMKFLCALHLLFAAGSCDRPDHPQQHPSHRHIMGIVGFFSFLALSSFLLSSSFISDHNPLPHSSFPHSSIVQISKLCSTYHNGLYLQRFLFSLFRSSHFYHPLSVNKGENMICYVLISNSTISSQIQQLPSDLRIVFEEISRLDRIHSQSIDSFLSLLSSSKNEIEDTFNHLYRRKLSSRVKILLTFGIGVINKFHGTEELKLENIRQRFLTRNPINDLSEFTQHHVSDSVSLHQSSKLHSKQIWNDALSTFRHTPLENSDDLCSDSQILIEILPTQQIQLSNLQHSTWSSSSSSSWSPRDSTSPDHEIHKACFLSLLSHFLSTYSLLIDLRIIFPKHSFNHWNKGIVQNNSYAEFYPYHEVGLDGTGQIIGLGKSQAYSFSSPSRAV